MLRIKCGLHRCAALSALLIMAAGASAQAQSKSPNPDVAARVGDAAITVQEVDAKVLSSNMKLAQQMYDARLKALEDLIMERALSEEAASKNMTVQTLINQKLAQQSKPVTDEQIQNYFNRNKGRMRGKSLEQMTGQIRSFLRSQNTKRARKTLVAQVKKSANVRIMLEAPRIEVAVAANDPFTGPRDAKVTIVEFSDFQ